MSARPIWQSSLSIISSSSRAPSTSVSRSAFTRQAASSWPGPMLQRRHRTTSPWPSKSHLKPAPSIPPPVPALYPKQVLLSDGSTFTTYLTSPAPATIRLTRDVSNNPLWAPATEKRGLGEGAEEGRVGRFRRRFEGLDMSSRAQEAKSGQDQGKESDGKGKEQRAFGNTDLDWMSEGAVEEKVGAAAGKGGKTKRK